MTRSSNSAVRQLGISNDILLATTLSDVLYVDAHLLETPHAAERTPEQWARVMLEDIGESMRAQLNVARARIELELAPGVKNTISGWRITSSTSECIVLQANSSWGFRAELAIIVTDDAVRLATFVTASDPQARDAWFGVVPAHLALVRMLLEHAEDGTAPSSV
ncbi:hypothetical protein OG921_20835 [Aldersonia sp. NBC_00410]|uniref:hypothetical protein n=1 Tax=Aldersonia sp. NBC_00410 TaxID=2975954 RepID=UPI0022591DD4|nr:hypothetical protein [Aldersonia sp. NBC_00410]MCX5045615.1 hypothetical protein [Aldersonia sp. NBC_00410]